MRVAASDWDTSGGQTNCRRLAATPSTVGADNIAYLRTKRHRMGHLLNLPMSVEA
jgi:hypothetical protein